MENASIKILVVSEADNIGGREYKAIFENGENVMFCSMPGDCDFYEQYNCSENVTAGTAEKARKCCQRYLGKLKNPKESAVFSA